MHSVKRIEIVADSIELSKILKGLKQANVTHYTVFRNVETSGSYPFGEQNSSHSESDATLIDMAYVIAFCSPEQLKPAVEVLRPILNKFGGACYLSDAIEVRLVRCTTA